ncbi:hypothetical protein ACFS5L_41115 [Streptomyces phyllanthi]|uniref:Uncharacterized protein n=1 Tax=Streptomyces phyllanthi TaxID=1803180 RepID=A0A5N8VZ68_9ACTN|nr:hypothetical protein [Streptomyces phyllanthi]MPY39394.1 hypothetical protein [Streptomyces phyllanthi]
MPGFRPTHVVPRDGLPAWESPDPSRPTASLDALLPVQLVERRGDWGQVVCANGWSAWVDGRLLVAVPQDPPTPGGAPSREEDPRPLLAHIEETLAAYRSAVEDLVAGRLDAESFHARLDGLRIGFVADGESLWLYDTDRERWLYSDGSRLTTYATSGDPTTAPPPERTRVVQEAEGEGQEPTRFVAEPGRGQAPHEPTRVVRPVTHDE